VLFMIHSMTGYGRAQKQADGRTVTVELKSVNNRFLDCSVRCPRLYSYLEEIIRAEITAAGITRGKIDVFVSVEYTEGGDAEVRLNKGLVGAYLNAFDQLSGEFGLHNDAVNVTSVVRLPDVLSVERREEDRDELSEAVSAVAKEAIAEFCAMRAREGERLAADVLEKAEFISESARFISERMPAIVAEYRERLTERIKEIVGDRQIDESRILTEAAVFADRVATDEETVRLASHITQLREIFAAGGAIGRKLDFLVQEINREINTIGSKANDLTVTKRIVEMKSELEKIREQIQNIE